MGKVGQNLGDLLEDFDPDLAARGAARFLSRTRRGSARPHCWAKPRHGWSMTSIAAPTQPASRSLRRHTRARNPLFRSGRRADKDPDSFSYSDGFGREIQKKIQAEPGDAPQRGPNVLLPMATCSPARWRDATATVQPIAARWVGSGRTVFNNKGKPVRQYEPFFSATHRFEFDMTASASARCSSTIPSSASSPPCTPTTPGRRSCSIRGSRRPTM